jgi:transcriptional regulator with GAF, ATPase, and Fis domain
MTMEQPAPSEPDAAATERSRTLLEINNAIISSLTRDALFRAIAGALHRVVPFDRTAIFLHDPAGDVLRLFVLESTLPSTYFVVGLEMAATESHVGRVFQQRQPLIRRDLATEREYPAEDQAYGDGVRSYVIVPLVARGTAIGVLAVASTRAHQYSDADAGFLREVAGQVALAVENMKAYEAISALEAAAARAAARYRTLLEINNAIISNLTQEDLFQAITRALRRAVPFDRSAILLHDPRRDVLTLSALEGTLPSADFVVGLDIPLADAPAGWVFRHRQPLLRRDLATEREYPAEEAALRDGVRALVLAPLIARGRAIGTLSLASATPGQYSEADAELVREVATQIALAVENMTAYGEIAALKARLEAENVYLQEEIRRTHNFDEMVGGSPALIEALDRVQRVAATDTTVLIVGETGTGKELIARALHDRSARKDRPLVTVNCGAIPAGLVESELFGHAKGAFTGALERRGRPLRAGRRRDSVSRRGERAPAGDPGEAPPGPPGAGVRAGGQQPDRPGRRPDHRGDQPGPGGRGPDRPFPLRPLLPPGGLPAPGPTPPRAAGGRAAARDVLPRAVHPEIRQGHRRGLAGDDGAPARLSLAGERPGAPERDRAGRRALHRPRPHACPGPLARADRRWRSWSAGPPCGDRRGRARHTRRLGGRLPPGCRAEPHPGRSRRDPGGHRRPRRRRARPQPASEHPTQPHEEAGHRAAAPRNVVAPSWLPRRGPRHAVAGVRSRAHGFCRILANAEDCPAQLGRSSGGTPVARGER